MTPTFLLRSDEAKYINLKLKWYDFRYAKTEKIMHLTLKLQRFEIFLLYRKSLY